MKKKTMVPLFPISHFAIFPYSIPKYTNALTNILFKPIILQLTIWAIFIQQQDASYMA